MTVPRWVFGSFEFVVVVGCGILGLNFSFSRVRSSPRDWNASESQLLRDVASFRRCCDGGDVLDEVG